MKQAHLSGRTKGLRPSQQRQLERLSHRRHPEQGGADQVSLERLAELVLDLRQPLHMVLDGRGLCRLLWVGPLEESGQLLAQLPDAPRRKTRGWRLISCPLHIHGEDLHPEKQDSIVALDLAPSSWLRFAPSEDRGGSRSASLWEPNPEQSSGWSLVESSDLNKLCQTIHKSTAPTLAAPLTADHQEERVLLLTLTGADRSRSERDLAELEGLVRSAGAQPVAVARQKQGSPNPQTIWGTGKLQEAALEVRRSGASLVITDRELTPVQARNLETWLDCPVMDRSELILDIFAQRAASAAGRLQVELAQLHYRLPRLKGRGRSLSRQGGGIGTRGPGETQLEKDRRAIARRIERLKREVKQLQEHRSRIRSRRERLPKVAVVGYTNAGKSSLLNALCARDEQSKVLAENKLFATLDPTTRRLTLPQTGAAPHELLLTDTVGFIRELPEALIEAFRATLEETLEADLLLLVINLADPDWELHLNTVHALLDSLEAKSPRQVIANQIDHCESSAIEKVSESDSKVIYLSATTGAGLEGLKIWLEDQFWQTEQNQPRGFSNPT
ncbi:MAG: GTPase HflX [Prochlorococcus sp.]